MMTSKPNLTAELEALRNRYAAHRAETERTQATAVTASAAYAEAKQKSDESLIALQEAFWSWAATSHQEAL